MDTALPPLLVAGHSHSIAMGVPPFNGVQAPHVVDNAVGDAPALALSGSWPRDDAYWDALVAAAPGRAPMLVWDGNQHQGSLLFEPTPPIDFILSSDPRGLITRGVAIVPESAMRDLFTGSLIAARALLTRLVAATDAPVLLAATPPPKGDPARVRELLSREQYFVNVAQSLGADIATVALTPVPVLLKAWTLVQTMMRELCDDVGAVYVAVPTRVQTPDGFLTEDCWSGDVTHANERFGREMLIEATAIVARRTAQAEAA